MLLTMRQVNVRTALGNRLGLTDCDMKWKMANLSKLTNSVRDRFFRPLYISPENALVTTLVSV
jgi:hypothetical protein